MEERKLLDELNEYVRLHEGVCPKPERWDELWRMLPDRQRLPDGGWDPPLPLILAAWLDTPGLAKQLRLLEQIDFAATHGALPRVDHYLRSLREDDWVHWGEL